jgi:hypothetical protein
MDQLGVDLLNVFDLLRIIGLKQTNTNIDPSQQRLLDLF